MLKRRYGLSRLASVVVVAGLIVFGTAVEAGAADPPFSVDPTTAMPGETITYTGTGWRDPMCLDLIVLLTINPGNIPAGLTGVKATGDISGTVTAPTAPGAYTLTAVDRSGSPNACTDVAAFEVVAPTTTTTAPTTTVPGETTTTTLPGETTTTLPGETTTTLPGETTTTVPSVTTVPPTTTEPEAGTAPVSSTPLPVTG